jgi:hypothetical protein
MSWPNAENLSSSIPALEQEDPARELPVSLLGYRPLPNLGAIVTLPVPLMATWTEAANKLLMPDHFSIVPYERKDGVQSNVWTTLYTAAVKKHDNDKRCVIVLATHTVRGLTAATPNVTLTVSRL